MTTPAEDLAISVTAGWNDWHVAHARLGDLSDIHWCQPKGAPRPILHAYVPCTAVGHGALPHACDAASAPHRIRVCVLRSHNIPVAHAELVRRAGQEH